MSLGVPNSAEPEDEDESAVAPDNNHLLPKVNGCLNAKYCREVLHLPTRSSSQAMSGSFRRALSRAYGNEYNLPNIVQFGGGSAIQWCRKLSFTDRYVHFLDILSPSLRIYYVANQPHHLLH